MQDNKPLPARYDSIDLIECIAMLFVVMYHSTTVPYDFNQSAYECVNYFIRAILSTCVPLFFFANGYLLINKKFDLKKHLKKNSKADYPYICLGRYQFTIYNAHRKRMAYRKGVFRCVVDLETGLDQSFLVYGRAGMHLFVFSSDQNGV